MNPIYQYRPISEVSNVRVLRLQRTDQSDLKCEISEVQISSGQYVAISYEWGPPVQSHYIRVVESGQSLGYISLTENVYHALNDLANTKDLEGAYFWIDQICIDQKNKPERSKQVFMMGNIYRSAKQVISYLGPEQDGDAAVLGLAMRIYTHFEHYFKAPEIHSTSDIPEDARLVFDNDDAARETLDRLHDFAAETICAKRLWTIQENLLNANTVVLRGTNLLPWMSICSISSLELIPRRTIPPSTDDPIVLAKHERQRINTMNLSAVCRFRFPFFRGPQGWTFNERGYEELSKLLTDFRLHQCKDPRDKVYGLLGLAEDASRLDIVPDYEKSVAHVFIEVVRKSVNSDPKRLDVLCSTPGFVPQEYDLPSWIPDWVNTEDWISGRPIKFGNASNGSEIDWSEANGLRTLGLHGLHVDNLGCVIGATPMLANFKPPLYTYEIRQKVWILNQLTEFVQLLKTIYDELGEDNAVNDLLCSTFLADPYWPPEEMGIRPGLALQAFMHSLYLRYSGWIPNKDDLRTLYRPKEAQELDCEGLSERFFKGNLPGNRTIFLTEKNKLCVATQNAQPGDIVTVLYGGSRLFVLRPHGHQFTFVGDAYIHGLMNGETLNDPALEKRAFEII